MRVLIDWCVTQRGILAQASGIKEGFYCSPPLVLTHETRATASNEII